MYRSLPEPLCPICGRADVQLISQREASQHEPFPSSCDTEETHYTFKCRCGVTFLHSVRHERTTQLT
jgi:hypothetical protein